MLSPRTLVVSTCIFYFVFSRIEEFVGPIPIYFAGLLLLIWWWYCKIKKTRLNEYFFSLLFVIGGYYFDLIESFWQRNFPNEYYYLNMTIGVILIPTVIVFMWFNYKKLIKVDSSRNKDGV